MEKIKYSVVLILLGSSLLSQSNKLENLNLIKIERIADSLVQICEFEFGGKRLVFDQRAT